MKLAIVGATGLVGQEVIKVIEEGWLGQIELVPVASERSAGAQVSCQGRTYEVVTPEVGLAAKPDIAIFSAGGDLSKQLAPIWTAAGIYVVDNSSAWRMEPNIPLVVPEINADVIKQDDYIIANPNCSTIQMVLALNPLHKAYGIQRIVVSTYQSVTGTGKEAVQQMMNERAGVDGPMVYPYRIDMNILPHIDVFLDNGYTKEEMKMVNETKKIMRDEHIAVTATTVRIPTVGGHSESVNVRFGKDYDLAEVRQLLTAQEGVVVVDDPKNNQYPMPLNAHGKNEVFVGRLRRDESEGNTLNMWIVADNLRKGAATNAVQIAAYLQRTFGVGA